RRRQPRPARAAVRGPRRCRRSGAAPIAGAGTRPAPGRRRPPPVNRGRPRVGAASLDGPPHAATVAMEAPSRARPTDPAKEKAMSLDDDPLSNYDPGDPSQAQAGDTPEPPDVPWADLGDEPFADGWEPPADPGDGPAVRD